MRLEVRWVAAEAAMVIEMALGVEVEVGVGVDSPSGHASHLECQAAIAIGLSARRRVYQAPSLPDWMSSADHWLEEVCSHSAWEHD